MELELNARGYAVRVVVGVFSVVLLQALSSCSEEDSPSRPFDPCMRGCVPVTELDVEPVIIRAIPIIWPAAAIRDRWEGGARVRFIINNDGTLCSVEIIESSGRYDVDERILYSTERWEFEPGRDDGIPVRTAIERGFSLVIAD